MLVQWLPVVGYADYEVSDHGQVRSLKGSDPVVLKPRRHRSDHWMVGLRTPGKTQPSFLLIHNLMLEAFVGPRPEGLCGLHRDDDPDHNLLSNLYWGTRQNNAQDRVRNGRDANARKAQCPQGHRYTAENTYLDAKGTRNCRRCHADRERSRRQHKTLVEVGK